MTERHTPPAIPTPAPVELDNFAAGACASELTFRRTLHTQGIIPAHVNYAWTDLDITTLGLWTHYYNRSLSVWHSAYSRESGTTAMVPASPRRMLGALYRQGALAIPSALGLIYMLTTDASKRKYASKSSTPTPMTVADASDAMIQRGLALDDALFAQAVKGFGTNNLTVKHYYGSVPL